MKLRLLISSIALSALMAGGAFAKNPFLSDDYWKDVTVEQVKADMAAGNTLLEKNKIGRQALHYALRGGASLDVLRFVLEQGVPLRPEDGKGVYAEIYAARFGTLETITLLEEFGADFKVHDYLGESPMIWVGRNKTGDLRVVDHFLELGLDINEQNRFGVTPAGRAAINSKGMAVFDYLVENGSDPSGIDAEGRDLFMRALTKNDNAEMLEMFYGMSEDPEAEDNYGLSGALLTVIDEGTSEERLAFLEGKGFDLAVTNGKGQNALHLLMANKEGAAEGMEALLSRGFDVNAADDAGNTPLLLALARKDPEVVEALIAAGADVTVANDKGLMPLLAALGRGEDFAGVIDTMLAAGADIKAVDASGANALVHAVKGGQPLARIGQILAAGVDVNAADGEGATALMYVAMGAEDPAVVEALLKAGADKTVKDVFEDTAFQMAADNASLKDSPVLAQLQ